MSTYALTLGPLEFICPLENVTRTLGEALENVGAALVPTERRPRPLSLKVPVEGAATEADPRVYGELLKRQTMQLLENRRWLAQGLFLRWEVDDSLAVWVLLGGGNLTEQDPGVSFGMYELELTDLYIVGAPGTHRMGRRLDLADRRTANVPRDTRALIYSTDFADTPALDYPLVLPGDVIAPVSSSRASRASQAGPQRAWDGTRTAWQAFEAVDGEVITYQPLPQGDLIDHNVAPLYLDDPGSVRIWDQNPAGAPNIGPPQLAVFYSQDVDPAAAFGWERLYGQPNRSDRYLAMDNGSVRVRWAGGGRGQGLIVELVNSALEGGGDGVLYPEGRLLHYSPGINGNGGWQISVVELAPERGVLEFRYGPHVMRAILQRGWVGPRIEVYTDLDVDVEAATLEWAPLNLDNGAVNPVTYAAAAAAPLDYVQSVTTDRSTLADQAYAPVRSTLVVPARSTYLYGTDVAVTAQVDGQVFNVSVDPADATGLGVNALAVQLALPFPQTVPGGPEADRCTAGVQGALALVDARAVPVVIG